MGFRPVCDIGKAIGRAFTPPGTGALEAQMTGAQNAAVAASTTATNALTAAIADATKAAVPAIDNPSALAANKTQMARLLAMQGSAWSFGGTPGGAPPTATKVLLGQ